MKSFCAFLIVMFGAASAFALSPGRDLIVPAAARAGGSGGSVWVTDLAIFNPGDELAVVTLEWWNRDQANPTPSSVAYDLRPSETMILEDVADTVFGMSDAKGAIHVLATRPVVATGVVLNRAGGLEFGQYVEGTPMEAAVFAGESSQAIGISNDDQRRTNVFLVDASGAGSELTLSLLDVSGNLVASKAYSLAQSEAILRPISELGTSTLDGGSLVLSVSHGAVVGGASRVNNGTGDPVTLPFQRPLCGSVELVPWGTYYGTVVDGLGNRGGIEIRVGADLLVQSIELSFPSAKEGCGLFFSAGGSFEEPFPFDDLLSGIAFTNSYQGGGQVQWHLELQEVIPRLGYGGVLSGTASSWGGSWVGCNGTLPYDNVRLGKEQ